MKTVIFAYSRQGCCTARNIMSYFAEGACRLYTVERLLEDGFYAIGQPSVSFYGEMFQQADTLIFVGACGIAVREIAPHVRDKQTDPAVICIDEKGQFVIPLLSGHIGGANKIALQLAEHLHAVPVVTTATDINRRFAVDEWAVRNGMVIDNMQYAKMVSAAILEGDVPVCCDFPVKTEYPAGLVPADNGTLGICITVQKKNPFDKTLRLIPKILHIGIGCRRGTADTAVYQAIMTVLEEQQLDKRAIKCIASIDLKASEEGLLKCCRDNSWEMRFYSAEELQKVQGKFSESEFVRHITGVDNVCERAARMGADRLLVKKTVFNGVTVSVAAENLEVCFGEDICCGHWSR